MAKLLLSRQNHENEELTRCGEAWRVGSLWFGDQSVSVDRRRCVLTLCTGRRVRVGSCSFVTAGLCKSRSIQDKVGDWLAPDHQLGRGGLLLRKEIALQLCVQVGREEELGWQGGVLGAGGELPPTLHLCNSETPSSERSTRGLVFGELNRSSANEGFYLSAGSQSLHKHKVVWRYLGRMMDSVHIR